MKNRGSDGLHNTYKLSTQITFVLTPFSLDFHTFHPYFS